MTKINDGGSAFPVHELTNGGLVPVGGMSLRDYFAGQALNALITEALKSDHKAWESTTKHAYYIADSMLQAREQKGET